jgi:hypothetical protein
MFINTLFDPLPLSDDHPPAPVAASHHPLVMCAAAWSNSPNKASTDTLSDGGQIARFQILPAAGQTLLCSTPCRRSTHLIVLLLDCKDQDDQVFDTEDLWDV